MVVVLVDNAPELTPLERIGVLRGAYIGAAKIKIGVLENWGLGHYLKRHVRRSCKTAGVGHRRVRGNVTVRRCDYPVSVDRSADPMKLQNERDHLPGNAGRCVRSVLTWVAAYDHALIQGAITRGHDFVVPHRQLITAARRVGNDILSLFSSHWAVTNSR